MKNAELRRQRRERRKKGIRKAILGTPERPRLTVYRSLKHTYAQIVNDLEGRTLVSASTNEKGSKVKPGNNRGGATAIGKTIAQRAKEAGITKVVFDRNGFRYHGRVKAVADAAREAGLSL